MKNYLFVAAIVTNTLQDPGAIRFRHTRIDAEDERDAYHRGGLWMDANHIYRPEVETINDYVIEL